MQTDHWHCAHSMRGGVYETVERPSVRPSVCLSHRSTQPLQRAAGLLLSALRAEHIDRQRRRRRPASTAPQHGVQKQMRAVSCWQPSWRGWTQTCSTIICDRSRGHATDCTSRWNCSKQTKGGLTIATVVVPWHGPPSPPPPSPDLAAFLHRRLRTVLRYSPAVNVNVCNMFCWVYCTRWEFEKCRPTECVIHSSWRWWFDRTLAYYMGPWSPTGFGMGPWPHKLSPALNQIV